METGAAIPSPGWFLSLQGRAVLTAFDVHFGRAEQLREMRADVLDAVYAKHPERFVRKAPGPQKLLEAAWINKPGHPRPDDQTIPAQG